MDDNELMAAVRGRFDPVRMRTPAEKITARGRSLRRRRGGAVASGALALALGAGLAVPALTAGTTASPGHVTLAAWTVDHRPDGSIAVTLRELRDLPALQRAVNAAGARVIFKTAKTFQEGWPKGCFTRNWRDWNQYWPAFSSVEFLGTDKYFFILHPAKIPPGKVLEIIVIPGIKQPPGTPSPVPLTPAKLKPGYALPPAFAGVGYSSGDKPSLMFTPLPDVPSCLS